MPNILVGTFLISEKAIVNNEKWPEQWKAIEDFCKNNLSKIYISSSDEHKVYTIYIYEHKEVENDYCRSLIDYFKKVFLLYNYLKDHNVEFLFLPQKGEYCWCQLKNLYNSFKYKLF